MLMTDELNPEVIVEQLLREYHPNELHTQTGWSDKKCKQICHALYLKWFDKSDWVPESMGDYWVIFRNNYGEEWIDEEGDFLCFDTHKEAQDYLSKFFKQGA